MARKPAPQRSARKTRSLAEAKARPFKAASATWQLQQAKNRFSELVEAALKSPREVTRHGKPAVVVVSKEEYE